MPFNLLPIADLPGRGDVVFCKWPSQRVGNYARPVLVSRSVTLRSPSGEAVGAVYVFYGTSQFQLGVDLADSVIIEGAEISRCNLKRRTRFDLSRPHKILWSDEYFVAPADYLDAAAPYIGCVSDAVLSILDERYPQEPKQNAEP